MVPAVLQLLQVQARVGVLGEFGDRGLDGSLNGFLQFCEFREEAFRDPEPRQVASFRLSVLASGPKGAY